MAYRRRTIVRFKAKIIKRFQVSGFKFFENRIQREEERETEKGGERVDIYIYIRVALLKKDSEQLDLARRCCNSMSFPADKDASRKLETNGRYRLTDVKTTWCRESRS